MKKMKFRFNIKKFIKNMVLVILFIILLSIIANNMQAHEEYEYINLIVIEGDTLWSIARKQQTQNEYYYNKDIREIIQDIKKINNLNNSLLMPGKELKIKCI